MADDSYLSRLLFRNKMKIRFFGFVFWLRVYKSVTHAIMKGEHALGWVSHALMRKHYPYRPGHPGAHLCPAKCMVETPNPKP